LEKKPGFMNPGQPDNPQNPTLPKGISVIVPVYNSQLTLELLLGRLIPVLNKLGAPFEVILVNDASADQSWETILKLVEQYGGVRGINLMRNYGQHNALLCGIRAARYEVCVTLDDDLQNPPEEIPKMLAALDNSYDVVYGTPQELQHGLWRNLASLTTKLALQNAMGASMAGKVSAFRIFRTQLRDAFVGYRGPSVCLDVLLSWASSRFGAVTVRHEPRTLGRSNYTLGKLITHALNMVTGYSVLPLKLASYVGFFFMLFGIGILAYVLLRYIIQGSPVQGFPFLASTIAIFAGAQLFALGIIGEYLARVYYRLMDRPTYAIRATAVKSETPK
jgi:undecaprenyl-phosphate 4-deoxy-4-formamido-L-arabinose transferase